MSPRLALRFLSGLREHPFPVIAHFDRAVALSFAFPEAVVRPLVPPALAIDTHNGLAFVTVAMVWTRALRPAGLPAMLGQEFFLAGYRVFTRLQEPSGRRLRGLRILRSDTDRRRMVWAGNLLTGYRYRHVRVEVERSAAFTRVRTVNGVGATTLDVSFGTPVGAVRLPEGSPFRDWADARRFAGPMPFTFSPAGESAMVVVEGSR
jgi:uncharacterized protein YqjF (DUF2071 family)